MDLAIEGLMLLVNKTGDKGDYNYYGAAIVHDISGGGDSSDEHGDTVGQEKEIKDTFEADVAEGASQPRVDVAKIAKEAMKLAFADSGFLSGLLPSDEALDLAFANCEPGACLPLVP